MVRNKKSPKKMTLRPADIEKVRSEFINEPNYKTEKRTSPWDGLTDRVPKPMIVRLSEVDQAKLDHILAHINIHKSKHAFCIDAIRSAIKIALEKTVKK